MTKFYEVRRRDGAARIGILSLPDEKKQTPLLFHVESLSSSGEEAIKVIHAEDANFNDLFQVRDVSRGAVLLPERDNERPRFSYTRHSRQVSVSI